MMCPATPTKNQSRGYIIPIGGAEAKHKDPVLLEKFISLCGGKDARVLVTSEIAKLVGSKGR